MLIRSYIIGNRIRRLYRSAIGWHIICAYCYIFIIIIIIYRRIHRAGSVRRGNAANNIVWQHCSYCAVVRVKIITVEIVLRIHRHNNNNNNIKIYRLTYTADCTETYTPVRYYYCYYSRRRHYSYTVILLLLSLQPCDSRKAFVLER